MTNAHQDYAAALALFLLEKTGSVFGRYEAHMKAAEQRALFGRSIGKGRIIIDGTNGTIYIRRKSRFSSVQINVNSRPL